MAVAVAFAAARCYGRRVRLQDLIGQDQAVSALRRAVQGGHVPHAYLFEGPAGVGKRAAALGFAMALTCPDAPGAGCGVCETCRRIEGGVHPDVPVFAAQEGMIRLEDAKVMGAMGMSRPHEAAARVVIIDDADTMNASAANRLLKTLEEPAARNHFVLLSAAPERLLPTIRSRTQRVRFRALPAEALLAVAAARGLERSRAEVAVALADGSVGRMLEAASADDGVAWQTITDLRAAVAARGVGPAFDAAQALAGDKETKQELPRLLGLLGRLYRDALVTAAGAPELALFADRARALAQDPNLGAEELTRALGAIVEADAALAANANPTTAIERLLLQLKRHEGRA
jgi:DNA polymerase-3 subunit delta'